MGVSEEQLLDLANYQDSPHFSALEKRVIEFSVAMSRTPVEVSDALFEALRNELDEGQLVELAALIAWENWRARFNRAFEIASQGFSEGAVCPMPERHG